MLKENAENLTKIKDCKNDGVNLQPLCDVDNKIDNPDFDLPPIDFDELDQNNIFEDNSVAILAQAWCQRGS